MLKWKTSPLLEEKLKKLVNKMEKISLKTNKIVSFKRYAGKWIALNEKRKVVAWGKNLEELDKRVKKLKIKKEVAFFLAPRKDEGPYVLI